MGDYVTLSCPNCGGKLEITNDIEKFACAHCGLEHIVKRRGGIVSISPLVESLKSVEKGVDRTAAELALKRLRSEIDALILEKKKLELSSIKPELLTNNQLVSMIAGGGFFVILGILSIISDDTDIKCVIIPLLLFGGILIYKGLQPLLDKNLQQNKFNDWMEKTGANIEKLELEIEAKKLEYEQNKRIVSS